MRRLLIIVTLLASTFSYAQINLSKEQLKTLPDSVRLAIQKASELSDETLKAKELSESASIGREIGEAVNGTLTAIEGSALRIADSNLGKTAIFIACWKLLYGDIVGLILGIVIFIVGNVYAVRILKAVKRVQPTNEAEKDSLEVTVFLLGCCYVVTCIIVAVVIL